MEKTTEDKLLALKEWNEHLEELLVRVCFILARESVLADIETNNALRDYERKMENL